MFQRHPLASRSATHPHFPMIIEELESTQQLQNNPVQGTLPLQISPVKTLKENMPERNRRNEKTNKGITAQNLKAS